MNGLYYLKTEKNENKAAKVSSVSASDSLSKNVILPGILWLLGWGIYLMIECNA